LQALNDETLPDILKLIRIKYCFYFNVNYSPLNARGGEIKKGNRQPATGKIIIARPEERGQESEWEIRIISA
jgi:hypothetical protein